MRNLSIQTVTIVVSSDNSKLLCWLGASVNANFTSSQVHSDKNRNTSTIVSAHSARMSEVLCKVFGIE